MTPETAARTNTLWSLKGVILRLGGTDLQYAGKQRAYAFHYAQGRCIAGLEHGDEHAAVAVLAHHVGLECIAAADRGHVADIDNRAIDLLDRQHAKLVDGVRCGVGADVVFHRADLRGSGRQDHVLRVQGGQQVAGRNALGLHKVLVHVDADLRALASVRKRQHGARHGDQLGTNRVLRKVGQLLLVQALTGNT